MSGAHPGEGGEQAASGWIDRSARARRAFDDEDAAPPVGRASSEPVVPGPAFGASAFEVPVSEPPVPPEPLPPAAADALPMRPRGRDRALPPAEEPEPEAGRRPWWLERSAPVGGDGHAPAAPAPEPPAAQLTLPFDRLLPDADAAAEPAAPAPSGWIDRSAGRRQPGNRTAAERAPGTAPGPAGPAPAPAVSSAAPPTARLDATARLDEAASIAEAVRSVDPPASDGTRADVRSSDDRHASPGQLLDGALVAIRAFVGAHRTAVLAVAGVVLVGGIGLGAVAAGSGSPDPAPAASAPAEEPEARAQPTQAAAGARIRTCSVADAAAAPGLAGLHAHVVDLADGTVLFDRDAGTAVPVAESQQLVTAAAALAVLGRDTRFETIVVKGAERGSIVLVGGGDLTLSRTPTGSETVYPGAAHLDELVESVRRAWYADKSNGQLRRVYLDTSRFDEIDWADGWDASARSAGIMPRISALEVDGDRDDPFSVDSSRGETPALRAGQAFASALGVGDVRFGTAPQGAALLGAVESPTVGSLVETMLRYADGALAEMLARQTAIRAGAGDSFGDVGAGIAAGLAEYGIAADGLQVADGSGLSAAGAVPPSTLTALLAAIERKDGDLGLLDGVLPASGEHGSPVFDDRFVDGAALEPATVRGVPGGDDGQVALAAVVRGDDGANLAVALAASGDDTEAAEAALDGLVAAVAHCGGNLAAD